MESEAYIRKSLVQALETIGVLDELLVEGSTPTPQELSSKLNDFTIALQAIHDAGNAAYEKVPLDLLRVVDGGGEPTLYLSRKGEQLQKEQEQFQERTKFLSHLKSRIAQVIEEEASAERPIDMLMETA